MRLLGTHRRWDVYLASQLPAPPWRGRGSCHHGLLERGSLARPSAELSSEVESTPDPRQPLFHFEIEIHGKLQG